MNYRYRAMTQDGQKLQGIIDANDERQARLRLREEGLFLNPAIRAHGDPRNDGGDAGITGRYS